MYRHMGIFDSTSQVHGRSGIPSRSRPIYYIMVHLIGKGLLLNIKSGPVLCLTYSHQKPQA